MEYDLGHIELTEDGRVPIPEGLILRSGDSITFTRTVVVVT